ncbi:MAG TPA: hypothetical protein P5137_15310, partial [Candidatus Brocadiia bacterium]|nr:hypothetical protein [Candidatus Brocadiia bacterium]
LKGLRAGPLGHHVPPAMSAVGIGAPWSEEASRRIHTRAGRDWGEPVVGTRVVSRVIDAQRRPSAAF